MLAASELQGIASQIRAAQAEARQIAPITSRLPTFDLPSAYAVAQLIHDDRVARGAIAVGRKIGFTNADMWEAYGVREPIWAHIYDRTLARLPATGGTCSLGGFVEPMIEPEIAFHFHAAPPVGADLRRLLACIDWVALSFEIVHCHFPGWKFQAADAVADGSLHGALLLGEPVAIGQLAPDPIAALEAFSVELCRDGERVAVGRGGNVLGNPLSALAHLIAVLSKQPQGLQLQANEIVTTGTITPAKSVQPGETWQAKLRGIGLPDLAVAFVA
ncbi:2-keto-4-pentenoate hydratase [Azospira restricta]|uniref:Decarboxylase n=1 Tax=Azospira restricta TaxID=404405 RepID=A0A974SN42_9RHOO|nr:fumarylacetoacetate hydrolase family protein [Azospira restricta]QRJ63310.1 decarboxylase [Azospira restricta]